MSKGGWLEELCEVMKILLGDKKIRIKREIEGGGREALTADGWYRVLTINNGHF